jgi:hypothetical protein
MVVVEEGVPVKVMAVLDMASRDGMPVIATATMITITTTAMVEVVVVEVVAC